MRNIVQYPITTEEISECLQRLLKEKQDKPLAEMTCGDMTCCLLAEAIKIINNTKLL